MHSGKRYNFFPPSSLVGCQWNSNLYMQSTVCLCAKAWRRNVITLSIYANKQHTRWKIETTEKVSGLSVSREFLFSVHMAEARNQLQNRRQYPLFIPQYLIFHTWEFCLIFFFTPNIYRFNLFWLFLIPKSLDKRVELRLRKLPTVQYATFSR